MEPLEFQKRAVAEITARARAFYAFHNSQYHDIAYQPRWATILIAPTAVGKTTTAHFVASDPSVRASVLRIAAPAYMPSGAHNRASKESITVIAEHIVKHDRTLLVIDELDKINDQDNAWQVYVRNELMETIGGKFPTGLTLPDIDDCHLTIEGLNEKLRTTVFFLAIGTFQQWYDSASRKTMGFGEPDPESEEISAEMIAQRLPRELSNRFGKIVRMPELRESDYYQMAKEAERKLPERLRAVFRAGVAKLITEAIETKSGVRFIESAVTATLINLPERELNPAAPLLLDDL